MELWRLASHSPSFLLDVGGGTHLLLDCPLSPSTVGLRVGANGASGAAMEGSTVDPMSGVAAVLVSGLRGLASVPLLTERTGFAGLVYLTEPTAAIGYRQLRAAIHSAGDGGGGGELYSAAELNASRSRWRAVRSATVLSTLPSHCHGSRQPAPPHHLHGCGSAGGAGTGRCCAWRRPARRSCRSPRTAAGSGLAPHSGARFCRPARPNASAASRRIALAAVVALPSPRQALGRLPSPLPTPDLCPAFARLLETTSPSSGHGAVLYAAAASSAAALGARTGTGLPLAHALPQLRGRLG
eukprot:SAG11_NODE_6783_length_1249_cov_6.673043_1_plen_297_part_10